MALSLILAMLKMNPAPVYILDEIDAALDLSHTQNVGKMIRLHFRQSQVRGPSNNNVSQDGEGRGWEKADALILVGGA